METTDRGGASLVAAYLRGGRPRTTLDGRLKVTEWSLDVEAPCFLEAAARLVAAAYVAARASWNYPEASLASRLPAAGTTSRKGDFGEIVAGVLYSQRLGRTVPFQRLEAKPVQGATVQGADLLALTVDYGEQPKPTIVEVKYRSKISPAKDLKKLTDSLAAVDEEYLISAWAAGVHLMDNHPDHEKSFALSAAQQLARLTLPGTPMPAHDRQAVIVTGEGRLTDQKLTEHWGTAPPVSELHVVTIQNLKAVIDQVYAAAALLDYGDAQSGVPALVEGRRYLPGIGSPISSTEAKLGVEAGRAEGTIGLVEAALWMLADWDGMGVARARQVLNGSDTRSIQGLAQILTGAGGRAVASLAGDAVLLPFAEKVRAAWNLEATGDAVALATSEAAKAIDEPGLRSATLHVGAAVRHRLLRHPGLLTGAAGAVGANVQHVVARWRRIGHQAMWPSQAAAVAGGLLDRGHRSLAIKMPTSAGKTALMELLTADALDTTPNAVVAVLAPTKALVSQLSGDLRSSLATDVDVRSSHGGLDFDTQSPGAAGILIEPGVTVMTPERFDLEWRRAATGDDQASTAALELVIVDEAHLLAAGGRGARLELVLARALRRGIRVVLLSSQFPQTTEIAEWLQGGAIESDWTPSWLERFVYFPKDKVGFLQGEAGDPSEVLTISRTDPLAPGRCSSDRPAAAAALAESRQVEGLVAIYSNERARIPKLVEAVKERFPVPPDVDSELEALAASVARAEPEFADLLRAGIGVHHALVPRTVRQVVEKAARRGWLRVIVCTSTLLEGIDFPTRTVIAAYTPQNRGKVEVARLRNLAGRAGRAGRFTSGTMIVMVAAEQDVPKWLRGFRAQLPTTRSALTAALNAVRKFARHLDILEQPDADDPAAALANLDAVIVAAAIEGAVVDGDFRAALEELLGRTLWYAEASDHQRTAVLDLAVRRAQNVSTWSGNTAWTTAFYRAGLPFASSVRLREKLLAHAANLASAIDSPTADHDGWLLRLAVAMAPATRELNEWADLPPADLQDALKRWISGEPEAEIRAAHEELWNTVAKSLETLLPWVLTAAIEFVATATERPDLRDLGHQRLGISRMRYGVPTTELCEMVRLGLDRVEVTIYANEYAALEEVDRQGYCDISDYIQERIVAAKDEADAEAKRVAEETATAAEAGDTTQAHAGEGSSATTV